MTERARIIVLTILVLAAIAAAAIFYVMNHETCSGTLEECAVGREQKGG